MLKSVRLSLFAIVLLASTFHNAGAQSAAPRWHRV